jgi:hypothetical protein
MQMITTCDKEKKKEEKSHLISPFKYFSYPLIIFLMLSEALGNGFYRVLFIWK